VRACVRACVCVICVVDRSIPPERFVHSNHKQVPRLQMLHQVEGVGGLPLARRGGIPAPTGTEGGGGKMAMPPPVFAGGDWKEATKRVRR
jgi:hypothetical protein